MATIQELLAKARAMAESKQAPAPYNAPVVTGYQSKFSGTDKYGAPIHYNREQDNFISLMAELKSCVLIGAAGTGKTTTMNGGLNNAPLLPIRNSGGHSKIVQGAPAVLLLSFTNRAVQNLRRAVPENLKCHCMTIHKALEYTPIYDEIWDEEKQRMRKTMSFQPSRNIANPITSDIQMVVIDEASMPSVELYAELLSALPHRPAMVFLGDINQLPPVFGRAILGFKMRTLPVVELTQVYRQALESPIISMATDIRQGKEFTFSEITRSASTEGSTLTIVPWQKKVSADAALLNAAKTMCSQLDKGLYNPMEDIILIPFNKSFGTISFNNILATHYARTRGADVYEIINGVTKLYLSVGDRVMVDKADGIVTGISHNAKYTGRRPSHASPHLTYEGIYTNTADMRQEEELDIGDFNLDFALESLSTTSESEEGNLVRSTSHVIEVTLDDGTILALDNSKDVSSLILAYAITVHKSQGSEWRKVYFITHHSHAAMHQRELLYTAITRAREELVVFCEKDTFVKGVRSQKIQGTSLREKIDSFTDKLDSLPTDLVWAVISPDF